MPATSVTREDAATEAGASFLVRLRLETRALHASTEARIAPAERLRDVHAYARLLSSLSPLYVFIEMRLASFGEWAALDPPLDVHGRRRAHLIVADLRVLGADASGGRATGAALPHLQSFAQAFGALYVVEGSRLGGRVLARHVSSAVGSGAEAALSFLRGNGCDDTGALWKDLRAALGGYAALADQLTRDAIVAGALDTFCCFDRQLARWEP
jgi:heme oxygenase (biliverdin-IX-beta and delta-forming)